VAYFFGPPCKDTATSTVETRRDAFGLVIVCRRRLFVEKICNPAPAAYSLFAKVVEEEKTRSMYTQPRSRVRGELVQTRGFLTGMSKVAEKRPTLP